MNFCKNRHNILNKDCGGNNADATRKGQNFRDKKKQEVGGRVDGLWPQ